MNLGRTTCCFIFDLSFFFSSILSKECYTISVRQFDVKKNFANVFWSTGVAFSPR